MRDRDTSASPKAAKQTVRRARTQTQSPKHLAEQRHKNAARRQKQRKRQARFQRYESAIPLFNRRSRQGQHSPSFPRFKKSFLLNSPFRGFWLYLKKTWALFVALFRRGGTGWRLSKFASLLSLVGTIALISWIHQSDDFFVYAEDVSFSNLTYVGPNELYTASQIEGWSTFWLNRDDIRERLNAHPYVADAYVSIELPAIVSIDVVEEEPVALWVTDAGTLWLLEDGTALAARHGDTVGLLRILDGQAESREVSFEPKVSMDRSVLDNARKLATYFPAVDVITFNRGFGLNFAIPESGLWVYWGDGTHFETKLKNLLTIQNELSQGRISGQLADLRVPEKPIVR